MRPSQKLDPHDSMKETFYDNYFRGIIDESQDSGMRDYFEEQAVGGWWNADIKKTDLTELKMVLRICTDLFNEFPDEFTNLASKIQEEGFEMSRRSKLAQTSIESAKEKGVLEQASALLAYYKTLFENEFRLWSTAPFLYAIKRKLIPYQSIQFSSALEIGGNEKFQALRMLKILFSMVPFLNSSTDLTIKYEMEELATIDGRSRMTI